MKRLIFTAFTIFAFSSAFAQFQKGRILAGGDISFSAMTNKTKDNNATNTNSKGTSFVFNPKVGYFFIDNLAGGLGLTLVSSTTKIEGSGTKYTNSHFTVSPFVRYYLEPGIFFQGQFGIGPGTDKTKTTNTTTTSKYTASDWSLGAGYAYFLNSNVAIEPFVGYGSFSHKAKDSDVKNITSGLFINIGFQIYLDPKK